MVSLSVKDLFGHRLESLWDDEQFSFSGTRFEDIKRRGFAIQDQIYYGGIVFVGINPSYNENTGDKGNIFYNPTFVTTYPYFREFVNISNEVGLPWSHLDLTFVRETSQKFIQDINSNNAPLFLKFLQEQYALAKEIIAESRPAVIVVCNALASEWIRNDQSLDKYFDEELGTYRISGGALDGTPLFYSGMLTGQRALDKGSRERLVWHIKKAVRHYD